MCPYMRMVGSNIVSIQCWCYVTGYNECPYKLSVVSIYSLLLCVHTMCA